MKLGGFSKNFTVLMIQIADRAAMTFLIHTQNKYM